MDIVPVNRTDVIEAELLKQRAWHNHSFKMLFPASGKGLHRRSRAEHRFAAFPDTGVCLAGKDACEIVRHGSDISRYRHLVIIENDEQVRIHATRVVERFHCLAGGQCAIADDGNYLAALLIESGGDRHSQCGTDRGARMSSAETIVFAFGPFQKT